MELQQQEVGYGETVRFICQARGKPTPTVMWLHNARQLAPSPRHRLTSRMLRVSNIGPQDEGLYQCMAENGVGSSQASARLITVSAGKSVLILLQDRFHFPSFFFFLNSEFFCFCSRDSFKGEASIYLSSAQPRQGAEGAASSETRGQRSHVAS